MDSSKKYAKLSVFPKDLKAAAEGAGPDTNELDALHMAMDSEQQAIHHYSKILENTEDGDVRKIIEEIIQQEKSHYFILQEEFTHLSDTGFWYEMDYLGG